MHQHRPVIEIKEDIPDKLWYGNKPWMLLSLKGKRAKVAIQQIKKATAAYPYKNKYIMWPGPNSNFFIAYVLRRCPAIAIPLPITAIGKDYFPGFCTNTPSNSGFQCSLKGIAGFALAKKEGLEISLLGFTLALNSIVPFVHIPGIS